MTLLLLYFFFFLYPASVCVVFGFVFHVFVQPCRVPGTNNDQEALKRKCEENVERHHLEGKSFILYVSTLTSQPFVWSVETVQTTQFYFRSV